MQQLISQLDYSIETVEERTQKLNEVLYPNGQLHPYVFEAFYECYNPNIKQSMPLTEDKYFFQKLESLASYILYTAQKTKDIVKPETQRSRNKKNVPLEHLETSAAADTKYTVPQQQITEQDIINIPGLQQVEQLIQSLAQQRKSPHITNVEKSRIQGLISELRADQYIIKESYLRPISFKRLNYTTTEYDFFEDTFYYNDQNKRIHVSNNTIDLGNPHHIHKILELYTKLRQDHYDDTQSDMRYILDTVDWLISESNFKEIFSRLIILRIDGFTYADISHLFLTEYNIDVSESYLSKVYTKQIPERIAKTYTTSYEEWYYTYKEKGEFKKCSKCGRIKLANTNYFNKDNRKKKDPLRNICKECCS